MSAIVPFEIFFDDGERARKFYTELFGWELEKIPGTEYWNISTEEGASGGLTKRFNPNQRIIDYFGVLSVREACSRVEALGGRVLVPRVAVPKSGYYTLCMDSEVNVFGLWEDDPEAKY